MQIGYPALVPIRHGNFNLDVRSPRNNEGQPDALLRPALPSALPLCESLKRCRTYIEAQTPNCRIFGFPSSTGRMPRPRGGNTRSEFLLCTAKMGSCGK